MLERLKTIDPKRRMRYDAIVDGLGVQDGCAVRPARSTPA